MSTVGPSARNPKSFFIVVGVVVGLALAAVLGFVLLSSPGGGSGGKSPGVVHSHASADNSGRTTTTPSVSVLTGSAIFVFVGYINFEIGGGVISSINDSIGDTYSLPISTGFRQNHTEDRFVSTPVASAASTSVSVTFSGGRTTMGGSVVVIDVAASGFPLATGISAHSGVGNLAYVNLATNPPVGLLLLGVSGQTKDAPFTGGPGETLLDTAGAIAGPCTDGMGFGTFSAPVHRAATKLTATLNASAV